jgi:serine/threonine protein kinase
VAKSAAEVGSTANHYQILGRIAVGGMAEIYLARAAGGAGVERYCVLKRILRERANDAQFVQMFIDEARLAAQLQHPSIASVYDIGMLGDSYFFTMEYVHGETVKALVQRAQGLRRPLPVACVLTIIAGTAAGLHHAHERNSNDGRPLGIVHRDISPSNLMVSYEGNVKIVDFGVAKADDRVVKTQSGTVKGKISYLSPEQCRCARVDRRSDLFSLGIVMWEMLLGARLYRRANDLENMTAIVHEPPPPPSSRRRDVPREIDDIVLRLLAKSVTDRFQTARDVVEAIENAALRARTILSTSAVSQLLRDLFGARAEPWLEYESETLSCQPSMIASRPLPGELGRTLPDPVERELAAVPTLALSGMFEEVLTDGSISSIDVESLESDARTPARPPAPRDTVPASPAARPAAPRAGKAAADGVAPLPGVAPVAAAPVAAAPVAAAPVAAQGSQPVHVAGLAASTAPAMPLPSVAAINVVPFHPHPRPDPGSATLREMPAPPPRPPTAPASATTLRTAPAPGATAAAAMIEPAPTAGPAGRIAPTGPAVTLLDRSPAGATAAAPARPATASPAAVTVRDASLPTWIGPQAAPAFVPASPSPWPHAKATPPAPFEALPFQYAAAAPGRPVAAPQQPAAAVAPQPAPHEPPAPHASSLTTRKWRPTRELALRVAPRLFTVMIPAATIGAILAWVVASGEPKGPARPPDPGTGQITGSPEPVSETAPGSAAAPASDAGARAEPTPADGMSSSTALAPSPDATPGHDDTGITTEQGSGGEPGGGEPQTPRATTPRGSDGNRPGATPGVPVPRSPDPPRPPPRSPGPGPGSIDLSILVKAMSRPKDCSGVVSACHTARPSPERAFYCFYAACCENNLKEARRLLTGNPIHSQKHLRTDCKQMGNPDVGIRPLDCEHDVRDCKN